MSNSATVGADAGFGGSRDPFRVQFASGALVMALSLPFGGNQANMDQPGTDSGSAARGG